MNVLEMNEPSRIDPPGECPDASAAESNRYQDRLLTIPNVICVARIIVSFALIWLAIAGKARGFVVGYVVLHLSDWVDGKLARWLNQRSDFGARLDSVSDAVLYGCLLIGSLILKTEVLLGEIAWLAVALASYALTSGYGLWKYGKLPSYHTRAAKCTQWVVLVGAVVLILDWSIWPLRIACVAGTLTNLETTAITFVSPKWKADVLSLWHALPRRSQADDGSSDP